MSYRPIIELLSISKTFGGVRSLASVDLTFYEGQALALAGENGSGKSTLIKVLSGTYTPDSGTIVIDGVSRPRLQPAEAIRAGIQVIYQDFSLFPNLSVAENIAFSQRLSARRRWVDRRGARSLASETLERLGVSLDLTATIQELPVASKQLVAIARALVNEARLVIMDEPTTALTEAEIKNLLAIVDRLKKSGVSVMFVSHKLQEVFSVCDQVAVLRNGRKVAEGAVSTFTVASLTKAITGRELPEGRHMRDSDQLGRPVVRLENVSRKGYLRDVSFAVRSGEIVGLAGMLGSGRTELAKVIFGLIPLDTGSIQIDGQSARLTTPMSAIHHGIAYVPEDRLSEGLFFGQTVGTNVEAGLYDRFVTKLGWLKKRTLSSEVASWLSRLNVKGTPTQLIHALSGGNQQRVLLARWLAQRPRLLILNGPSVGVDVGSKADIHRIIGEFARDDIAILLISDDLSELVACSNRVLVMRSGAITAELEGSAISELSLAEAIAA